jgi:hypothetical protein
MMPAEKNKRLMEILEKPGSSKLNDGSGGPDWEGGARGRRDVSYDQIRLIFNDELGSLDGQGRRRGLGQYGNSKGNIMTKNITDSINRFKETMYGENIFPDIIDVKPLMSSRDELVLPRDEFFSATDIRSLIIIPFCRHRSSSIPNH